MDTNLRFDTWITNSFNVFPLEVALKLWVVDYFFSRQLLLNASNAHQAPQCQTDGQCTAWKVFTPTLANTKQGVTTCEAGVFPHHSSSESDSPACAWTTNSASSRCKSRYLRNAREDHSPASRICNRGTPAHCKSKAWPLLMS